MKIVVRVFVVLAICGVVAVFWFWREANIFLHTAPETEGRQIFFDVPQGARFNDVACDLANKGLITDARKFSWLARFKKQDSRLQAGRFSLNSGWTPEQTLDALVKGGPVLYRITIPEGLTWWQTGRLLEKAGLVNFDDFQKIIMNPEFLRHYGIPFATAEGFLMPDTYFLRKPSSPMPKALQGDEEASPEVLKAREEWKNQARDVAGRLVDNFWRKSAPLWRNREKNKDSDGVPESASNDVTKLSPPETDDLKRLVILASIVEKETGLDSERARVAGVYANRLKRNMLLQADPTVIYGLGENFSGRLRRVNLEDVSNVYNTYQRPGLPPGPICSFGEAALKAAITPEKHDFLYFVAISDRGGHNFSKTYDEHNRAVNEYRRQRKK